MCDLYFVELTVADWSRSVQWYRQVLRLELVLCDEHERFALLRAGTGRIALKAGSPTPGTVLLTLAVDDLTAALHRLAAFGIQPEGPCKVHSEGYRRAQLRDPDGYRLCLFEWLDAAE